MGLVAQGSMQILVLFQIHEFARWHEDARINEEMLDAIARLAALDVCPELICEIFDFIKQSGR